MSIIEIINQIEEDRRNRKRVPYHALLRQVITKATEQGITEEEALYDIDRLEKANMIQTGNTINDRFIKTV